MDFDLQLLYSLHPFLQPTLVKKKENPDVDLFDVLRIANIGKDGTKNEIAKKMEEVVSSGKSKEEEIAEVIRPQRNGHVLGRGFGVYPTVYRYMQPYIERERRNRSKI